MPKVYQTDLRAAAPVSLNFLSFCNPERPLRKVDIGRRGHGSLPMGLTVTVDEGAESEAELYSRCALEWASFIPPQVAGAIQLSTSWAQK
jgi:hypothetical protein